MKYSKNILIICRDTNSARKLGRFQHHPECYYILASDDPRVHKVGKGYSWIKEISWLEKTESFYAVAHDVLKYLEIINKWLFTLANENRGFSSELLFWVRQCEGGMTTQRIQDLLLLIRSYLYLFNFYNIKRIVLFANRQTLWEDSILIEVARSRNIAIDVKGCIFINMLFSNIRQYIEIIGRTAYYIFNFLRVRLYKSTMENNTNSNKTIVFQLCSSAKKHVFNIMPIMKGLKDKGYKTIALCWSLTERYTKDNSFQQIRAKELNAVNLENSAPLSSVFRALLGVIYTWKLAKLKFRNFISIQSLNYKGVQLASSLWPSIRFFILAELIPRYIFNVAIKNYLQHYNPVAIKIWGEGVLMEGHFLLKNLSLRNKPLIFYWIWVPGDSPYDSPNENIDLYLASGEWHYKHFEKRGIPCIKIAKTRMTQFNNIKDFLRNNKPEQSFIKLGINKTFSRYILYDNGYILRGYLSINEQVSTLNSLLNFARNHPTCALLIKPHPNHKKGFLERQIKHIKHNMDLENIYLFNSNSSTYDILNICDILITKYSTLGIEAMFFQKPVISVILDKEERWKIFEGAADYFYDLKEMSYILNRIAEDDIFYKKWRTDHLIRQKSFLKSVIGDVDHDDVLDSSEIIAVTLDQYLTNRTKSI